METTRNVLGCLRHTPKRLRNRSAAHANSAKIQVIKLVHDASADKRGVEAAGPRAGPFWARANEVISRDAPVRAGEKGREDYEKGDECG